jgi:dihydrofolate reductase
MTQITSHMSISLDGFVAGPDQSRENPLGIGGRRVHLWHLDSEEPVDLAARDHLLRPVGAYIMGRNMFGPIRGEWDEDWRGWWGDEPPYHAPVFVLTHHAREPLEMQGGTTFHFVTDGFEAALEHARSPATATSTSPVAPRPCARRSSPARSTSSTSTSRRFCWATASASSTACRSTRPSSPSR